MFEFVYPVKITPDEVDGGYVVTFPDVPAAITQGDSVEECLTEAVDCLDEAISACIKNGWDIPVASEPEEEQYTIALPAQTAFKAAVYLSIKDAGISKTELGRRIGASETEARRILDPHHGTKIATMEKALASLGKRAIVRIT